MPIIIRSKISADDLKQAAEDLNGYVKFVVDVERKILSAGGVRHVDGEKLLLHDGSKQQNLWGGGLDIATNELDYDSMINIRSRENNPSREVLSVDLRTKIDQIVRELLG